MAKGTARAARRRGRRPKRRAYPSAAGEGLKNPPSRGAATGAIGEAGRQKGRSSMLLVTDRAKRVLLEKKLAANIHA